MTKLIKTYQIIALVLFSYAFVFVFAKTLKMLNIIISVFEIHLLVFFIYIIFLWVLLNFNYNKLRFLFKQLNELFNQSFKKIFKYCFIYIFALLIFIISSFLLVFLILQFYPEIEQKILSYPTPKMDLLFLTDFYSFISFFIRALFLAPIMEEFVFRRVLFLNFRENFSFKYAALFSSILFGMIHIREGFIVPFIIGFYLAFIFEKEKNIVLNAIVHAFTNLIYILVCAFYFAA